MKKQSLYMHAALIALTATLGVGCSGGSGSGFSLTAPSTSAAAASGLVSSSSSSSSSSTPTNPGTVFLSGGGSSTVFIPDSKAIMQTYAGHSLSSPINYAINVNVYDVTNGSGEYGGSVRIAYQDNGTWYSSNQQTGTGTNHISGYNWYVGMNDAGFNKFFTSGGKTAFHGFFQDALGAIVVVLDNSDGGLGDGITAGTYSGSVYFKNFTNGLGQVQSPEQCWFIEIGPFNCGTFLVGGKVTTASALYPSSADGYSRLGTFTGLNVKSAFNQ